MSRAVKIDLKPAMTTRMPATHDYDMHDEDYKIDGLMKPGVVYSFNKSTTDTWIACTGNHGRYMIDSSACTAKQMTNSAENLVMKILTRDSVQVLFPFDKTPAVYVNGIKTGSLKHAIKSIGCSDGYRFKSRFIGSSDTGIYYLSGTNLVYYTWASLSMLDFKACSILQQDVIDFDLTSNSYVCITTRNTFTKDGVDMSDIKSKACHRHLTTIGIVGSHAVCSATVTDNSAVIQAYGMNGVFESSVMIQVAKGPNKGGNEGICWIMPAGVTHGHAAFIAVERYRYVHLVAIDSHGKLSVTSRVEVTKSPYPIMCVSAYDIEGQFIVGGNKWIKKISVKM